MQLCRDRKITCPATPVRTDTAERGLSWHQFRHIHSSLLNDLNVPVKIAQEQLGHASISTTLNIYTHVVDASHRKAVETVEERLFFQLDPNGPKIDERGAHDFADKQSKVLAFESEEKRLRPQASAGEVVRPERVSVRRTTASAQRDGESKGAPSSEVEIGGAARI